MADIKLNNKVEFAYSTGDITKELSAELESRFLYQKILVIDSKYEFGQQVNLLAKNIKCDFEVIKDIHNCCKFENFSCILIVNCNDLNKVKHICTRYKKPYIIVLTKIYDINILNGQIVDQNKNIVNCNLPLGVVLVNNKITSKHDFVCKFLLEYLSFEFDNMQSKIDNLFFYNLKNNEKCNDLTEFFNSIEWHNITDSQFEKITKLYLMLCVHKSTKPLTLLDRLTELGCDFAYDNSKKTLAKFMFQYVLTSILKRFFELWTKTLTSTVNLKKYQLYLNKYNLSSDFRLQYIQEQKIHFLLEEFRQKFIDYVNEHILLNNKIKSLIADINVDFLYSVFNYNFKNNLTDFICLEPIIFKQNSILTILQSNGLLNFDI